MTFASQGDLTQKNISFRQLSTHCYAFTAEGDPNSGVVIGKESILVMDAQATPLLARKVIESIRTVSPLPIKHLVLSHYHAVRVLGASAYQAPNTIASAKTLEMIHERGNQDRLSEFQRFPRLFQGHEEIPGLTWPNIVFKDQIRINLGGVWVSVMHLGEGHTRGDSVVWIEEDKTLFGGDLVEAGATPYCGDAQLQKWPSTLDRLMALNPRQMVPGRGEALLGEEACQQAIEGTKRFVTATWRIAQESKNEQESLKQFYHRLKSELEPFFGDWAIFEHCLPFNAKRAYDEVRGVHHPKIWTDEIDLAMWKQLNG